MRGGAPLFELSGGPWRSRDEGWVDPQVNHCLSPRLVASPLSSNSHGLLVGNERARGRHPAARVLDHTDPAEEEEPAGSGNDGGATGLRILPRHDQEAA